MMSVSFVFVICRILSIKESNYLYDYFPSFQLLFLEEYSYLWSVMRYCFSDNPVLTGLVEYLRKIAFMNYIPS